VNKWTKEKPTPGLWWVSIAPEKRSSVNGGSDLPAVIKCRVSLMPSGLEWIVDGVGRPIDHEWLTGALWLPVDPDPVDPFEFRVVTPTSDMLLLCEWWDVANEEKPIRFRDEGRGLQWRSYGEYNYQYRKTECPQPLKPHDSTWQQLDKMLGR